MSDLPKGWKETRLDEIVDITSSKRIFYSEYVDFGIAFYRSKEIIEKQKGNSISTELFITKEKYNEIKNNFGVPVKDDLLLTSVGTLGIPYLVKENEIFYFKDGNLTWFRNYKGLEPEFLYFYILSPVGKKRLNEMTIGSTQSALTISGLKKLKLELPPLDEQKQIANILSSFDKKIELLKEQNQTLETMAQTIFKEWFVDFNYPNATSEMIDSEMGEIPKGWRVFKIEELVNTVNGYSYKGNELVDESTEALVTLKSFNRNGGFQTRGFKPFQGTPKKEQEVVIGDLIVAHTDLTQDAEVLGNPAFVFENGGFNKMYITMDLVKVNSKVQEIQNSFLYYVMKDKRFKGHCVGYSNGTTVLHLSKKAIPEYKIALPENLKLAQDFSNLTENFTRKISHNILEIKNLEDIKDSLLPKLMSGKIRIKGFKID